MAFVLLFILGFCIVSVAQTPATGSTNTDLEKVASDLVNKCANIKESEIVFVSGGVKDLELLENIAVNVRKIGAHPLVIINSDRMTRKMYTEVPEKYDSQSPDLDMHLMKFVTTFISVPSNETSDLLADIPPERFAKRSEANEPILEMLQKNPIKMVELGNGMYPTKANADEFEISLEKLTDIFWSGINVDYEKLAANGKKLESMLAGGNELVITNKNGTNLTVNIAKSPAFCSDGIISAEDLKKGYAGSGVFLPAGEVYLAPVAGSANGKVVIDNYSFMGKTIEGLVLEFKNGKLVSMNAKSEFDSLKKYYDAQGKGKDEFGLVDFGINPNVVIPAGSKLQAWMPAGMVTIGMGNNIWAGGSNDANSALNFFLPGCSVKVDGKTLVDNGNLKLQ